MVFVCNLFNNLGQVDKHSVYNGCDNDYSYRIYVNNLHINRAD